MGSLLVGLLVGMLAGALSHRGEKMGCIGKMILGLVGAFLGRLLFGSWGPSLAGTSLLPSILGACILLVLFWKRGS